MKSYNCPDLTRGSASGALDHDPTAADMMRFIMHDDVDSSERFIKIERPRFIEMVHDEPFHQNGQLI